MDEHCNVCPIISYKKDLIFLREGRQACEILNCVSYLRCLPIKGCFEWDNTSSIKNMDLGRKLPTVDVGANKLYGLYVTNSFINNFVKELLTLFCFYLKSNINFEIKPIWSVNTIVSVECSLGYDKDESNNKYL